MHRTMGHVHHGPCYSVVKPSKAVMQQSYNLCDLLWDPGQSPGFSETTMGNKVLVFFQAYLVLGKTPLPLPLPEGRVHWKLLKVSLIRSGPNASKIDGKTWLDFRTRSKL